LSAGGAEVHPVPAPLSPRVRADVAEAWAVLGRAGGCGVAPAPESREQLQEALCELWAENERRRQALCLLFSKHTDLAPEAATASISHGALQSAHGGAYSYTHSASLLTSCGGSWSQLPWRSHSLGFKRSCRKLRQGDGPRLELDGLPDSLLSYIYSFAPKLVPRDLAVSKRFSTCLMKTERVVLDVKCGSEVTEASLMRFERGVELIGKRCWGLADKLTNALTYGWSALVSLDLSDNELDDQSIQRLIIALQQRNTNITSLSLCDNNFTGIGALHMGEALSHFVCLRKLNLNGNRIGPVGARHIAVGLEKQQGVMTRLTHLGMGGSAIGAAGIRALVTVLSPASSPADWKAQGDTRHVEDKGGVLRKLDLSACALGSEGMEALQPLLKVRAHAYDELCALVYLRVHVLREVQQREREGKRSAVRSMKASEWRIVIHAHTHKQTHNPLSSSSHTLCSNSGTPVCANFRCRGTN
jgi:hypothetical protein